MLLAVFAFLSSCSDDSSSPSKSELQPTSLGSWWIYENYSIDSNNVSKKLSGYDSVVVSGKSIIMEKEASVFKTIEINSIGEPVGNSDNYYNLQDNKLYMHSKAFTDAVSSQFFPFTFKEQWMKVADKNDDDWKAYEDDINDFAGPFGSSVDGKILINGEKGGSKQFTIDNKTVNTSEFILTINFTGSATIPDILFPITITIERKMYLYFADGIGLVYQKMPPNKISLLVMNMNLPGSETFLRKYSIK